jgi:cation:H+ antiporter
MGLLVSGIGLLIVGAHGLVRGAVALAGVWGWNEAVVGLTVVAAGTSLPELAACLVAAARKQGELAIGNILGSCIFNLLAILGVAGTVAGPLNGSGLRAADVYVMLGLFVVLLPFAWTGFRLQRWEGGVLLLGYGGYLFWLWPK